MPKTKGSKERQVLYLFPLILKALDNESRRRIIEFLILSKKKVSYREIWQELGKMNKHQLENHLHSLQIANLIERYFRPEEPENSFYSISTIGENVYAGFYKVVKDVIP